MYGKSLTVHQFQPDAAQSADIGRADWSRLVMLSIRSAARGNTAASSIRLALRASSIVATSSARFSRCVLRYPYKRCRSVDARTA